MRNDCWVQVAKRAKAVCSQLERATAVVERGTGYK